MLPMAILLNYFLWGKPYLGSFSFFFCATLTTFIFLGGSFITYGLVAISLRNRFPSDEQLLRRLSICLSIFFLMSAVYISFLLLIYDYFDFYGYEYAEKDFTRAYIAFVVINVFLTFLNEGVYRFERYKATATETEELKKEYMHSQLLGLKSQMNPHFLFNSLNTLSSLIHEDAEQAEDFLDHMSKVYRYLLRNNEEQLVTIETELGFIRSYYYLLKARHADGLEIQVEVPASDQDKLIPPLTLQMIVENTLSLNSVSRTNPLVISIGNRGSRLTVRNNVQPKMNVTEEAFEVLENISNKFRLLCQQEILICENAEERVIELPMIPNKQLVVA